MAKDETSEMLAKKAVVKAGSRRKAAAEAGISRAALDRALSGQHKLWPRSLGKLTRYVFKEEETPKA